MDAAAIMSAAFFYLVEMNRNYSYLNSAVQILAEYKGEEPLASFLKKYFSANKKYGSRDRKQVSHLCYCYFRQGKMQIGQTAEERIIAGLFLCSEEPNEVLQHLRPEWNDKTSLSLNEKLLLLHAGDLIENIFPFADELSSGIDQREFILSHLKQPDVFLRLRPGKEEEVKVKLESAGIRFKNISSYCLALPNASKIDQVVELNKEAVIQDYSSQRTGELLQFSIVNPLAGRHVIKSEISAWDCCAGSGGKSIMLHDLYPKIDLTVSDSRESILINLKKRFREAGITNYKSFIADLEGPDFAFRNSGKAGFELILADVPCTGSGAWSRTPEQLYYFDKKKIAKYAALQKRIVSNVISYLQPGGQILYITCSVFKKENEEAISFLQEKFHLQLIRMEILKGYDLKADTLFVALLSKVTDV